MLTRAEDCFQGRELGMQSVWHADHVGMPAGCTTAMAVHRVTCGLEGRKVEGIQTMRYICTHYEEVKQANISRVVLAFIIRH